MRKFAFGIALFLSLFSAHSASAAMSELPEKLINLPKSCEAKELLEQSYQSGTIAGKIERIVIIKSERQMYLLTKNGVGKKYYVSLGFTPEGAKVSEGDGKTPEGSYFISSKNPQSSYHLALKTSYPEATDLSYANENHLKPGHSIMIHGFPNATKANQRAKALHGKEDWTEGCIAVTNDEIEEIFPLIKEKTPLDICP